MHRSVLVGIVALLLVVTAGGSIAIADASGPTGISSAEQSNFAGDVDPALTDLPRSMTAQSSGEFDSTTFEVTVHENGDARWTFRYERRLASGEESEFEAFAEEFEETETELYEGFERQARALTDTGSDRTDREMEATEFNRSAGIDYRPNAMGYVEMSFTWTAFAPVDDDGTVTVGDVLGLYIGPDQSLVIQPDDGLVFESAQPEGQYVGTSIEDADSMTWHGEREFLEGQPRVVLVPEGTVDDGDGGDGGDGGESPSSGTDHGAATWVVAAGLVALALGVGAAFAWYRFGGATASDESSSDESGAEATPRPPASGDEPDPISDEELMTDEDRVVDLIRENGGRMKQVNIVEETGWSKSKVSMLLSDMEEDGTISKLRVGRENIISLDGYEPEATKSPFDE